MSVFDVTERRAIEADCTRLIHQYINLNDAQDWEGVAALYTEDARFARPSQPGVFVEGREAILRNLPAKTGRTADQWADALLAERLG